MNVHADIAIRQRKTSMICMLAKSTLGFQIRKYLFDREMNQTVTAIVKT